MPTVHIISTDINFTNLPYDKPNCQQQMNVSFQCSITSGGSNGNMDNHVSSLCPAPDIPIFGKDTISIESQAQQPRQHPLCQQMHHAP
jgi:hypothetical protein